MRFKMFIVGALKLHHPPGLMMREVYPWFAPRRDGQDSGSYSAATTEPRKQGQTTRESEERERERRKNAKNPVGVFDISTTQE